MVVASVVDVFVSYSHEDRRRVHALVRQLSRKGLDVWFDGRLRPSETWPKRLRREIGQRRVFLLFVTSHSLTSDWCRWELYQAARANRLVIPIRFEAGVEMPPELHDVHYVDCSDHRNCAKKVLKAIDEALSIEETIYRLRPRDSIGVRGETLLRRHTWEETQDPSGPRYPTRWRDKFLPWQDRLWRWAWGVLGVVAVLALLVGLLYVLLRGDSTLATDDTPITTPTAAATLAARSVSPTAPPSPSPPPPTATPTASPTPNAPQTARVCALGTSEVWVYEQPLADAHAFVRIRPQECMEVWWQFTNAAQQVWLYTPKARRGTFNRGGWVLLDKEAVRLEGDVPAALEAALCEAEVAAYGVGLSTTTSSTPRYALLERGNTLRILAHSAQEDGDWYYAAAQPDTDWLFGWIPADQVKVVAGQCPSAP